MLSQAIQDAFVDARVYNGRSGEKAIKASAVAWLKGASGAELSADLCATVVGIDLREIREQL